MRRATFCVQGVVLSLLLTGSASATAISWGTPTYISGDADVSHAFGFVDGINGYSGTPNITIGDATFYQGTITPTFTLPANLLSSPSGDITLTQDTGFPFGSFSGGSAAYNQLVNQNGNNTHSEAGTATLSGLHSGSVYQVEVWSATVGFGTTTTLDGTVTLDGGGGQFVLGTFIASSATESFTYTGSDGSRVSAVESRNLSVPEPATCVLAATGALALLFAGRRFRRQG